MTIHGLALSVLAALALTSLAILIRGGTMRNWAALALSTWVSFLAGHFFGELAGWHFWRLGSLNFFPALLGAVLGLLISGALLRPVPREG